ncbi:hypothetical protein FN846DRAFT_937913 [Sphaerosporella brunnea]|uniref:Uncharacterized protein n=1 Tax=Sphaerosporella brunnea TaxID=1250544 RepID=A0A5J5F3C4_9PEZI|nr:hypothetical protein FN846DRAFT_937913 [Sphaerosporella brunnea]
MGLSFFFFCPRRSFFFFFFALSCGVQFGGIMWAKAGRFALHAAVLGLGVLQSRYFIYTVILSLSTVKSTKSCSHRINSYVTAALLEYPLIGGWCCLST